MTRTMAIDADYWPTLDPSITSGSREQILDHLWGTEKAVIDRTIDVHIRRLRQAIEDPSAYRYIHTVHGVGYRFDPQLRDETQAS